jgi:hypothetical protein
MLILTSDNAAVEMDTITPNVPVSFCVLEFSKQRGERAPPPDYFWKEVIMVETYTSKAAMIEVGEYSTMIPTHWSIMVTYADQAEMVAIEDIASRDLEAFCLNPIDSYLPMRLPVRLRGIYEMNWVYPTLLPNELLAIPIGTPRKRSDSETSREPGPLCILAGEKLKIPDTIDVGSLW